MNELKNISDGQLKENENKVVKTKKYRVHGKITKLSDSNSFELSFYECDEIKCSKIIYRKPKKV